MTDNNLNNLRHSCAHLLAAAIAELYPDSKNTIGPAIDTGFYYDFDNLKISEADFPAIEAKMHELVSTWESFKKRDVDAKTAKQHFAGNPYKLELINDLEKSGDKITFYDSGTFTDLCKGGHCQNPNKELIFFKLLSVAGAYWRGDEKNKMLTRIYGTAFYSQSELDSYLKMLEEAKNRDHKKLGVSLDLFTFSELVGSGLPLWTPKGTLIRTLLDEYVWQLRSSKGYEKVEIPHITKKDLYQTSGHWEKFGEELFRIKTREGHEFVMKPMNCPHHTQIFNHLQRSYREMPQRYANTTMVYRDEQTGELSGLSRVRSITQDDAHVFCRESQIKSELQAVWDIVHTFYSAFGFNLKLRLSFCDPQTPEKYLGTKETWENSQNILEDLAKERGIEYYIAPGEAAFYGPKLDFMATDSLGRQWQVATIQLDRNMPERFDLYCINEQGDKERIIMIHAAIMGSIERFTSILIEHFAGAFPVWLSPIQVCVIPISEKHLPYAQKICTELKNANVRVELNDKNEPLNARIRDVSASKIPYCLVVGDKEVESDSVSVRKLGSKESNTTSFAEFMNTIQVQIASKASY